GHFNLKCLGERGRCGWATPTTIATAVNGGFGSGFGAGGPRAQVDGSDVVISTPKCPISAGFATVSQ
ncbi:MAG: hypothetical protein AAFY88_04740, partial [Acidobacteriota bacterium]